MPYDGSVRPISRRGKLKLAKWTVFGTLGCVGIALAFNFLYFGAAAPQALRQGLISAAIIPVILAGPLFFYLTLKLRELAVLNHRLREIASTDSLTSCLNRGAFTAMVEAYLDGLNTRAGDRQGALLVVDADHFKSINDRFGHHSGDQALRIIAGSIRSILRGDDLVGRLGGEEFGVFLPGVSPESAALVGERIRQAICEADFRPDGVPRRLSVSVGGAVFESEIGFSELFRIADERLYDAKNTGRDRVVIAERPPQGAPPQLRLMH
jgi:diguanylate cyclase